MRFADRAVLVSRDAKSSKRSAGALGLRAPLRRLRVAANQNQDVSSFLQQQRRRLQLGRQLSPVGQPGREVLAFARQDPPFGFDEMLDFLAIARPIGGVERLQMVPDFSEA